MHNMLSGEWYSNDMFNVQYYERIGPQGGRRKKVYTSGFSGSKEEVERGLRVTPIAQFSLRRSKEICGIEFED